MVSYTIFVHYLALDSLWRWKFRALIILVTSLIGVGLQVAVFGLLMIYAQHFSAGDLLQFAGATVDPRTSFGLLVGVSLTLTILLLLSALFIYFSRRGILRLGREYEEFCAKRVFRLLEEGGDFFCTIDDEGSGESYLFRLVRSDSRLAGRVLRMLLALAIPMVTMVAAIAVALYLEPMLSLIIAALGSLFLVYQYRASRLAAHHSLRFEQLARAAGAEYRKLLQYYKHQAPSVMSSSMEERLFAGGAVRKQLDAYEGRLRAVETSRLVSGLFMSVVIGLILGVMGAETLREGSGWERLLLYVVALRFAFTSLQSVFSSLTAINRFYPQVRRYMAFVLSFSPEDAMHHPPRDQYAIVMRDDSVALTGSVERVEIGRGDRVALVTPLELNRYTLAAVCETLLGGNQDAVLSALHSVRYVSASHTCPSGPIRRVLRLSETTQWNDLCGLFANDGLYNETREALPKNLDNAISPAKWALLEPRLKITLALIAAHQDGCKWLFVDAADLQVLDAEVVDFYLEKFSETIVCILYRRNMKQAGLFRENWVVVADSQVVGIGSPDWFKQVELQASEIFEPNRKQKAITIDDLDEE